MTINCTFKDFKETQKISKLFTISNYAVYAGSNLYGGKNYEYILFICKEDLSLDRACLFSIYNGKQLVFEKDESLLISKSVLNITLNMFESNYTLGKENVSTMWMLALYYIREHRKEFGLEQIPLDIPKPESFEYCIPENTTTNSTVNESFTAENEVAPINKASNEVK